MTADLRRLAEGTTPGPWSVEGRFSTSGLGIERIVTDAFGVVDEVQSSAVVYPRGAYLPPFPADAAFIAACDPQTVIALLDERDRYREALLDVRQCQTAIAAKATANAALEGSS